MIFHRLVPRSPAVPLLLAATLLAGCALAGCAPERAPTRTQLAQQRAAKLAAKPLGPAAQPIPILNDAQRVINSCGQPLSDNVTAIYSKLHNGPVRSMVYHGSQSVVLSFIPSQPLARRAYGEAPLSQDQRLPPQPPPNAIWRFYNARVEKHELLTTDLLARYLPCAASALHYGY